MGTDVSLRDEQSTVVPAQSHFSGHVLSTEQVPAFLVRYSSEPTKINGYMNFPTLYKVDSW